MTVALSILEGYTSRNHDRTLLGTGVLVGAQIRDPA